VLMATSPVVAVSAAFWQGRRPSRDAAHLRRSQSGLQQLYRRWCNGRPKGSAADRSGEGDGEDGGDHQSSGGLMEAPRGDAVPPPPTAMGAAPALSLGRLISNGGSGWSTPRSSQGCRGKGHRQRQKVTAYMRRLCTTRLYMPSVVEGPKAAWLYSAPTAETQELLLMLLQRSSSSLTSPTMGPASTAAPSLPHQRMAGEPHHSDTTPVEKHLGNPLGPPARTSTHHHDLCKAEERGEAEQSATPMELPRWVRERPLSALYYQPWGLELLARYEVAHQRTTTPLSGASDAEEGSPHQTPPSPSSPSSPSSSSSAYSSSSPQGILRKKQLTWASVLRRCTHRTVGSAGTGTGPSDAGLCPQPGAAASTLMIDGSWPRHLSEAEEHAEQEEMKHFNGHEDLHDVVVVKRPCYGGGERRHRVQCGVMNGGTQSKPSRRRQCTSVYQARYYDFVHDATHQWSVEGQDEGGPQATAANEEEPTTGRTSSETASTSTPALPLASAKLGEQAKERGEEDEEEEARTALMTDADAASARGAKVPPSAASTGSATSLLASACEEDAAVVQHNLRRSPPSVDVIFFLQMFLRATLPFLRVHYYYYYLLLCVCVCVCVW